MFNPTIRKHRGVFVAEWYENGKRIRRSLGTSDKLEANRRLEHIHLTNRVIDRNKQKTVGELFEEYISNLRTRSNNEAGWRKVWKYLSPTFASIYPQYITPEMCTKYCVSRGVSSGTLNLELGLLRSIVTFAYKHRLTPNAIFIPVPAKPSPRTDYLAKDTFLRLLRTEMAAHIRLFLILGVTTGARSNAIQDLTWEQVNLGTRTIDLRTNASTAKGRAIVPINDTAYKYLTEAAEIRRSKYVIEYNGDRIHSIGHALIRLSKRTGIKVSPHMLRHSAAVWMAEGGVPMSEIAQYLGHSNTAITERVYARYSPGYLRKAASHLEIKE